MVNIKEIFKKKKSNVMDTDKLDFERFKENNLNIEYDGENLKFFEDGTFYKLIVDDKGKEQCTTLSLDKNGEIERHTYSDRDVFMLGMRSFDYHVTVDGREYNTQNYPAVCKEEVEKAVNVIGHIKDVKRKVNFYNTVMEKIANGEVQVRTKAKIELDENEKGMPQTKATVVVTEELIKSQGDYTFIPIDNGKIKTGDLIVLPFNKKLAKEEQIEKWKGYLKGENVDWEVNDNADLYAPCDKDGIFLDEDLRAKFGQTEDLIL